MALAHKTRGAILVAVLAAVALLSGCGDRGTILTVNAGAATRTEPDLAVVTLGVIARGATAAAAQQAQNQAMSAVRQATGAAGVEDADIQTVSFSLEPQYAYARGAAPRLTGYQSRNTISIRVKNLDALSGLIDATVAQGANELQGIQFTFQDVEASRNAARAQAVETAEARAAAYAEAVGKKVGRILSITEPGATFSPWERRRDGYLAAQNVAAEQSAAGSIAPGQVENETQVTVVFELR